GRGPAGGHARVAVRAAAGAVRAAARLGALGAVRRDLAGAFAPVRAGRLEPVGACGGAEPRRERGGDVAGGAFAPRASGADARGRRGADRAACAGAALPARAARARAV